MARYNILFFFADIVLVGEGYSDFISIDNVHGAANDITAARTMDLLSLEPSPDASAMMDDSEIKGILSSLIEN